MKDIKMIFKKEFDRVFKDKKLVFSLFILPAIIMVGMYSLIGSLASGINKDIKEHISVVYMQNTPDDIKTLIKQTGYNNIADITFLEKDAAGLNEIEADILEGKADLLVSFDDGFTDKIANFKNGDAIPGVKVGVNTAKDYSSQAYQNFLNTIANPYKESVVAKRIGGAEQLQVFNVNINRIVNEDEENGQFLAMMLPYLITFLIFASAMSIVIDAIAGEKERGTMARLLLTPLKRRNLAIGKIIALAVLSIISAIVYALSMVVAMPMMMKTVTGGATLDVSVHIAPAQILMLVALLVILAYLYVSLIAALAIRAKDVKTASTLVSPLYIVIMIAALTTMFTTSKTPADYIFAIPVYGTALSVQKIMTNSLEATQFLFSCLGNIVVAALCTLSVTKAFNSEKVMFNA
ncbi:MAG: ABC transporter permease [Lachnospiraceae bacterium]|nr:ABC transporter permease [Lachnospiraceae bacterium]